MPIKYKVRLSLLNIIAMRKYTIKMLTMFSVIVGMSIFFFGYHESVVTQLQLISREKISECFVETEQELKEEDYKEISEKKIFLEADEETNIENVTLFVDGKPYEGQEDYSFFFQSEYLEGVSKENYAIPISIEYYSREGCVFSENDRLELQKEKRGNDFCIEGEVMPETGEIVCSEYILEHFCLDVSNAKKWIGKKISLYDKETETYLCKEKRLAGIIQADIFYTAANGYRSQIIGSLEDVSVTDESLVYRYYAKDFISVSQLCTKLQANAVSYTCSPEIEMYQSLEKQQIILEKILTVILTGLYAALMLGLTITAYFYVEVSKKYRCMLDAIGMQAADSTWIFFGELVIESVISVFIGSMVGWLFLKGCSLFVKGMLGINLGCSMETVFCIQISCFGLFLVFNLLLASIYRYTLKKIKVVQELA